jgi:hypothetical protein
MSTASPGLLGPAGGLLFLFAAAAPAGADLALGPEETIRADGAEIAVPGYSVPSFAPWDDDALPDLIVGEGGGVSPDGKVRVYRNVGTVGAPGFADFSYVQSNGADLVVPGGG